MAGVIEIRDRLARAVSQAFKVPERDAQLFAQGFANELAAELGGTPVYVGQRTMTDAEIVAMFDGGNADEVCKAAGITRRTLQRKLRQAEGGTAVKPTPPEPPAKRVVREEAPWVRRRRGRK